MLVFVDANVWYPVVLADLVLRSVEIGRFDLAWTDESLAEVERVLVERKGLTAQNATYAVAPSRISSVLHGGLVNHYHRSGGYYPEGGGQPADHGTLAGHGALDGVEVLDVRQHRGAIRSVNGGE